MSTVKQQRCIHVLLRELGVSDERYRAMLSEMFGVGSSKDLTVSQASKLIDHLKSLSSETDSDSVGSEQVAKDVPQGTGESSKDVFEPIPGLRLPIPPRSPKDPYLAELRNIRRTLEKLVEVLEKALGEEEQEKLKPAKPRPAKSKFRRPPKEALPF